MPNVINGPRQVVASGFRFTECPRWNDGFLYFSDMHDNAVYRLREGGSAELVCRLDCNAGGLGFDPDGHLLVAAMDESRIVRAHEGGLDVIADLADRTRRGVNDMVVSPKGLCYVGRYFHPDPPYNEPLLIVGLDGQVRESPDTLDVANGMVLTADSKHLIVAESAGCRLAILDLDNEGLPVGRRVFGQLKDGYYPDGICGDASGGIWVACTNGPVLRVLEGGKITHRIDQPEGRFSYACALGGATGDTLFICTAGAFDPVSHVAEGGSQIEAIKVPFKQAGIP